jgi:hypothetical protein
VGHVLKTEMRIFPVNPSSKNLSLSLSLSLSLYIGLYMSACVRARMFYFNTGSLKEEAQDRTLSRTQFGRGY